MGTTASRKSMIPLICVIVGLIAPLPIASVADDVSRDTERKEVDASISAVKPALVRIHVAEVDYTSGREVKSEASGSGVIISRDGYVVTNHHVAGWAKTILCTLSTKEEVEADLVGTDPLTDIAVVKLRGGARQFPTAQWGDSSELRVGDTVLAMGSPLALSQSVTKGVVSNVEMIMPDFLEGEMTLDGEDVGSMVKWIGHDASIFHGNSGGPLVNLQGKIVGINEISMGLSGAIPSRIASSVADQLIANGKVRRAWIGIGIQPLLKSSKLDRGVLLNGVIPGSPAQASGFKPGDIVVKAAGRDVLVRFAEQLPEFNQMVAALPIGQPAEFVVQRGGQEVALKVVPQDRPDAEPRPREFKQWGMCATDLSLVRAREMKRSSQAGVAVYTLRQGGPSSEAKPALDEDDIILEVAGKPVHNVAELAEITSSVTVGKKEPTPVLVAFDRKSQRMLTVVKVGIREIEDPGKEVKKAYLPIEMQVLTSDLAEALGVPGKTGVRVTHVFAGSAAEKSGLKVGDLIVGLDGSPVEASQPEDTEVLPASIRQYKVGSTANLSVLRDKKPLKVAVVLPEAPPVTREMKKYHDADFEFTARDISYMDRVGDKLDKDVLGVYVEDVSQGGWAALGRLQTGDIIWQIDGQPVNNVADIKQTMAKIVAQKPREVVCRVRRGLQEIYVEIEADWDGTK